MENVKDKKNNVIEFFFMGLKVKTINETKGIAEHVIFLSIILTSTQNRLSNSTVYDQSLFGISLD